MWRGWQHDKCVEAVMAVVECVWGDRRGAVEMSICNRDPLREKWITFFTSFF